MNTSQKTGFTRRASFAALLLLGVVPTALLAASVPDLPGDWQGKLAVDPNNSLTVRFTFTKGANGVYTAVLNSPDNPGVKDVAVNGVSWDGTSLKLSVPTLSGAYAGTLKGGSISGQWTQPGATLPLDLAPWAKPVMTAASSKSLAGNWNGALKIPAGNLTMVFQFKQGAGGLEGTFGIPDQGLSNSPVTDLVLENGELKLKTLQGRISFQGKLNGDRITGKLKLPDPTAPAEGLDLILQRGEYQAKALPLKLSPEVFASLKGKWTGAMSVTNPQTNETINLPIVLRFESNTKGEYVGYLDSVAQNVTGIVVSEATLDADGKLKVVVGTIQAEYNGALAGGKITGEWGQGGQRRPLVLTRTP